MDTFLINRNSPLRSGVLPKLRHRSPSNMFEESASHGDDEVVIGNEKFESDDCKKIPEKEQEYTDKPMSE